MPQSDVTNLGRALTALGLEDQFLSNGELITFPLEDRSRIVSGIVAEKLKIGKWREVIRMIYGGGKADMIFDGDRNQLREEIVHSATADSGPAYFGEGTLDSLIKSGEIDLLFRLTQNIPLEYRDFIHIIDKIDSSYFDDPQHGDQRTRKLHEVAGKKALAEQRYPDAFEHFVNINNEEGLNQIFKAFFDKYRQCQIDIAEKIAIRDHSQKESRLKQMILKVTDPLVSLKLFNKYKREINLTEDEVSDLRKEFAKKANSYDLSTIKDPEILLLWAENHAASEPKNAYKIFKRYGYDETPLIQAVHSGLKMDSYKNEERALNPSEISEIHLRRAYDSAPFPVKVRIAEQLKDTEWLRELSLQAQKDGETWTAYRLWIDSGCDLEGGYITDLRANLITDNIKKGGSIFLYREDKTGKRQAYNALMQLKTEKSRISEAHKLALDLGDEALIQPAREQMTKLNPTWALDEFKGSSIRSRDEKGIEYVLTQVACQFGVDTKKLRKYADKYLKS